MLGDNLIIVVLSVSINCIVADLLLLSSVRVIHYRQNESTSLLCLSLPGIGLGLGELLQDLIITCEDSL